MSNEMFQQNMGHRFTYPISRVQPLGREPRELHRFKEIHAPCGERLEHVSGEVEERQILPDEA